jgi:hypothetical protein
MTVGFYNGDCNAPIAFHNFGFNYRSIFKVDFSSLWPLLREYEFLFLHDHHSRLSDMPSAQCGKCRWSSNG